MILCNRRNSAPSDTTSHLRRNEFSALRWHNDLVIVLLMVAVQHLVRLAWSCKMLCVPAVLSPCTCDADGQWLLYIVANVCCVLLPSINGTLAMGHGFLSLPSTCHVTHVLFFKNSTQFDRCPYTCVRDHNITMQVHWLSRAVIPNIPPGVRSRTFRGTRKNWITAEKGHYWVIYLQLQDINLK
jgi:hypothetical protein